MQRIRLATALPLLALATGCGIDYHNETAPSPGIVGSQRFVSESRPIQAVRRIVVTSSLRAIVKHTGAESLDITAEDNIVPLIATLERDGSLFVGWMPGVGGVTAHGIDIRIGVRELTGVDVSGAGQIDVGDLMERDFSVALSGAARFTGAGSVESLVLDLSGASQIDAPGLTGRSVTARLSGASRAVLRITDTLRADITGASVLEFLGNPTVDANVSQSSTVRRIGP